MGKTDKHSPPDHWEENHNHEDRDCDFVQLPQFLEEVKQHQRGWYDLNRCGWIPSYERTPVAGRWKNPDVTGRGRHSGVWARIDNRIRRAKAKQALRRGKEGNY